MKHFTDQLGFIASHATLICPGCDKPTAALASLGTWPDANGNLLGYGLCPTCTGLRRKIHETLFFIQGIAQVLSRNPARYLDAKLAELALAGANLEEGVQ